MPLHDEEPSGARIGTGRGFRGGVAIAAAIVLILGILATGALMGSSIGSAGGSAPKPKGTGGIAAGSDGTVDGPDIAFGAVDGPDVSLSVEAGSSGQASAGVRPAATSSANGGAPAGATPFARTTPTPTVAPTVAPTPAPTPVPTIGKITLEASHWCYRLDTAQVVGPYPTGSVFNVLRTAFANGVESWVIVPNDIGVECAMGQLGDERFAAARSVNGAIGRITLRAGHWCYRLDTAQVVGPYAAGTVFSALRTAFANGVESWIIVPPNIGVECAMGQNGDIHYDPV